MESKGLSQKDFAKLLGKNESEISKWMRGTHNFTISTIVKIEQALGCKILSIQKTVEISPFIEKVSLQMPIYKDSGAILAGHSRTTKYGNLAKFSFDNTLRLN